MFRGNQKQQVEWSRAEYGASAYFVASYRHPDVPAEKAATVAAEKPKMWPPCWLFRCCGSTA